MFFKYLNYKHLFEILICFHNHFYFYFLPIQNKLFSSSILLLFHSFFKSIWNSSIQSESDIIVLGVSLWFLYFFTAIYNYSFNCYVRWVQLIFLFILLPSASRSQTISFVNEVSVCIAIKFPSCFITTVINLQKLILFNGNIKCVSSFKAFYRFSLSLEYLQNIQFNHQSESA